MLCTHTSSRRNNRAIPICCATYFRQKLDEAAKAFEAINKSYPMSQEVQIRYSFGKSAVYAETI